MVLVLAVLAGAFLVLAAWVSWSPGESYTGPLPTATDAQKAIAARLEADVRVLAAGPRDVTHPAALRKAADHVFAGLAEAGYSPRRLPYQVGPYEVHNLEAEKLGTTHPEEVVVVGAHYDSVETTPGADDNASGVAGLLEIARALANRPLARTVRFVSFVNEEPPYFRTEEMGSRVYVRAQTAANTRIVAMFSLEMLGYYDARPGTQRYPPGMSLFYPDRADFIAFVGTTGSRALVHRAVGLFREHARFPSEAIAAPAFVQGVDFSDHASFAAAGYPAVMVTDTSFMRNAHYHEPTDTHDTLDYDRMSRVVEALVEVMAGVANAPAGP